MKCRNVFFGLEFKVAGCFCQVVVVGTLLGMLATPAYAQGEGSAELREDKILSLTVGAGFRKQGGLTSIAVGVLWPSMMIELELAGFGTWDSDEVYDGITVTLRDRFFLDSFFGYVGVQSRLYDVEIASGSDGGSGVYAVHDAALDLGFGNRWQWETVHFGFTWVGLSLVYATLNSSHVSGSTTKERVSTGSDVRLLHMEVGLSF